MKQYKIYIIQMHTKTIPATLIKFITRYKYSHIALSFDKSCNTTYSFGRKKYNSIIDCGFVEENKNGMFFKKFKDTKCRIFEISVTKEQYYKLKEKMVYMKDNEDLYKHDFIGIILRYFKVPICFKNKYVCSQFVAKLLEESKIYKFNKKIYFVQPKDFEMMSNTNEIYTGKYLLYK